MINVPHRSPSQVAKDRKIIGRMYLRGALQSEIAEKLRMSQPQVSRDLKALHGKWLKSALIDFSEAKSKELAKVDMLEVTYWQGWLRSLKDTEKSVTEKNISGNSKARIEREGQIGDPRFLAGIQWCINKRCDIIGIDAPKKIAPTDPNGQNALTFNITIDQNGNKSETE